MRGDHGGVRSANFKVRRMYSTWQKNRIRTAQHFRIKMTNNENTEKKFFDNISDFLNISTVKKTFNITSDVFSELHPFLDKPTLWNGLKSAFGVTRILVDVVEIWADDFFAENKWTQPYTPEFNPLIVSILHGKKFKVTKTSDEDVSIRIYDLNGCKIGYVYNDKTRMASAIHVETEKLEKTKLILKKMLWERHKDANLVMRHNKKALHLSEEPRVAFEADDAFVSLPSSKATEYSAYLKRCLDAGVARSVMLYGPPGTGKSTMARTIVESLGLKSFRIRVEDIGHIESSTMFEAIGIFEPDSIILDDFDRTHEQVKILEVLEHFQKHVKLIVATVNDRNSLDEAILRPGRFDELICVKQMDEDVIRNVLGEEHKDAFETVKDWPIAFIQEYVKRRRFMSQEEASNSIIELAKRVKRLDSYSNDDELSRVTKDDEESQEESNNIVDEFRAHNRKAKARRRAKL